MTAPGGEPDALRDDMDGVPRKGDVIAGKYEVLDVLGAGGMGVVVAARETTLNQRVAVKFMLPRALRMPEAKERFLREARAAVAITSEHVARVVGFGSLETGAPYIVMEYLTGADLGALAETRGPLPITDVVDYVLQACEALAEAHSLGIVHRDLKPCNLFLATRADGSPLIKVLDFGLSKAMRAEDEAHAASLTATSMVAGSPHYMSPEQVRSLKNVDARTDVWSLGVILYELLTGQRPFEGETPTSVIAKVLTESPAPPRSIRSALPAELERIVLRCLHKDVNQRIQTISELARAVGSFGSEGSRISVDRIVRVQSSSESNASQPAAPERGSGPVASTTAMASTMVQGGERGPRRRAIQIGTLAISTALIIGAVTVVWARLRAPSPDADSSTAHASSLAPGSPSETAAPRIAAAPSGEVSPALPPASGDPTISASVPAGASASSGAPSGSTAARTAAPGTSASAPLRRPGTGPKGTPGKDDPMDSWQ